VTGRSFSENKILFVGDAETFVSIADLCVSAMTRDGILDEQARNNIWMVNIKGSDDNLGRYKRFHAKFNDLASIVKEVQPSVLIGVNAGAGAFSSEILQEMRESNRYPIIYALSNPACRSECTGQEAYDNTEGRCLFVSSSHPGQVQYGDMTFKHGVANSAYIFPGVALGVISCQARHVPEEFFLIAAETLARHVTKGDIMNGSLYPPLSSIMNISLEIAIEISKFAYKQGKRHTMSFTYR
jgi:malate dehydrogenase (oxaloacetate-decarboxylating)(NADP+)